MLSKSLQDFIKKMPSSQQTEIGREMVQMRINGLPNEMIDDAMSKRLGLVEKVDNTEIKDALGEILINIKDNKKDIAQVKKAISDIPPAQTVMMPFNTDLAPISGKDFGIKVDDNVSIGDTKGMTSKIVTKEETKKDDTSNIVNLLKQMQK